MKFSLGVFLTLAGVVPHGVAAEDAIRPAIEAAQQFDKLSKEPQEHKRLQKQAEERGSVSDFYTSSGTLSPFSKQIEHTEAPEIGFFPEEKRPESEAEEEAQPETENTARDPMAEIARLLKENLKEMKAEKEKAENSRESKTFASRDDVIKQYGDPTQRTPVLGVKDAPLPFKGMMAAKELGDEMLFHEYAKQYVHYITDVQGTTDSVMKAVNNVMRDEGLLPGGDRNAPAPAAEESIDEGKVREEIRKAIVNYPVDPYGEVDVYVFLKGDSKNSELMLPELDTFSRTIKANEKVRFAALMLDAGKKEELQAIQKKYNLSFELHGGAQMAKKLGVKGTPTLVFVPRNLKKKMVVEEGYRRYFFLDEVLMHMQGRKGA